MMIKTKPINPYTKRLAHLPRGSQITRDISSAKVVFTWLFFSLDLLLWTGMIQTKRLSVSIVIPVYNEADSLASCLRAIAAQITNPLEVIVVDNNSTDDSAAIAKAFDFVKVIQEPKQGVVYARDCGFDSAQGDIIGRIDADSLIAPDWVDTLQRLFVENEQLAAVTGRVRYHGIGLSRSIDVVDFWIRRRMARLLGREVAMQGANMAVRKLAWQSVKSQLCRVPGMHEDYDLAIHLAEKGELINFDESLEAKIGFRQADQTWRHFAVYAYLSPKTYALHRLKSRRHMYPIVALVIACYPILKVLHRGYDEQVERFTLRKLMAEPTTPPRANPALFVD